MDKKIRFTSVSLVLICLLVLTASPVNAGKLRTGWQDAKKEAERQLKELYNSTIAGVRDTAAQKEALERIGLVHNQKSLSNYFTFDQNLGPNLDRFEDIVFQRGFYTTLLKKEDMTTPSSFTEMVENEDSDAYHAFTAYCEEKFQMENWNFYRDSKDLNPTDMRKLKDIYFRYVQEGSKEEINIPSRQRDDWTLIMYKEFPREFSSREEEKIQKIILKRFFSSRERRELGEEIDAEVLRQKIEIDMKELLKKTQAEIVRLLAGKDGFSTFETQYGQLIRTHVFDVARGKIRQAIDRYKEQIKEKSATWEERNVNPKFWLPLEQTLEKLDNVVQYFARKVKTGGKVPAKKWLRKGKKFKREMQELDRALERELDRS